MKRRTASIPRSQTITPTMASLQFTLNSCRKPKIDSSSSRCLGERPQDKVSHQKLSDADSSQCNPSDSAMQKGELAWSSKLTTKTAVAPLFAERWVHRKAGLACTSRLTRAGRGGAEDRHTSDRVAPGRCRPGAPTDPYVLTLEHTVPQIRVSLRVDRATEPYAPEPVGNDRRCH